MCDCITRINEYLAERNTQVTTTIALENGQLRVRGAEISTHKKDDSVRGKPVRLTAAFCPFCGAKYDAPSASESERTE